MRRVSKGLLILAMLLAAVPLTGCWDIVKLISVSLGNLSAVNGASSAGKYIDWEIESSDYADHKDKFDDVEDVVVLGTFTNNLSTPVSAEVWIVNNPSSSTLLPDKAAVQAAGGVLSFSMSLAGNETKNVDWDTSAGLFTDAGKDLLVDSLEGDTPIAVYVFGSTGTYDIDVTNAQFVAVIYIGFIGG